MTVRGPSVRELTHHLAECPSIFLEEPVQPSGQGGVYVHAVVSDLLLDLGGEALSGQDLARFRYSSREAVREERNRLRLVLLGAWLFSHSGFQRGDERERLLSADKVHGFLATGLNPLARLVAADELLGDPDRREELARLGLDALDLVPHGEGEKEAKNRLAALSSVEREKVLAQARAAEARARAVQEQLARKQAAQAAANSYYNE